VARIKTVLPWGLALLASVALAGDGPSLTGLFAKERSMRSVEASILRSEPAGLRSFLSRDAVWVVVAKSRADWDRAVAPALADALGPGGGLDATARAMRSLPSALSVVGPEIAGARVEINLPDDAGEAAAAVVLPPLLARNRAAEPLLNLREPSVGFVRTGAFVERNALEALYVPSRPKSLQRGRVPSVEARPLPRDGRTAFAVLGGKWAEGEDAEDMRRGVKALARKDELDASRMKTFPRKAPLLESLKSIRVDGQDLELDGDWYRTLTQAPSNWSLSRSKLKHPTRYLAEALPVMTQGDGAKQLVVGIVAFYTPLFLTPTEAGLYAGDVDKLLRGLHDGELPFFRVKDDVLLYRGHVDRWLDGDARRGEGKARRFGSAMRKAEEWADRAKSRNVGRALRGVLPFRMQAIPDEELQEMVDRRKRTRGRVFTEDLAEWLSHQDKELGRGDLRPVWSMAKSAPLAGLSLAFADKPSAMASNDVRKDLEAFKRKQAAGDREPEPDEPVVADAEPEPEPDRELKPEPKSGSDFDFDDWEPGPVSLKSLEVFDFYTPGNCSPGGVISPVVEFLVDGIGDDAEAPLRIEYDLMGGGRNITRDGIDLIRGSGVHEFEFDVLCPESAGTYDLQLLLIWRGEERDVEASTDLVVAGRAMRTFAKLRMPAAKRCVDAGPMDVEDDYGMAQAQGLSPEQIGSAVRSFQEETLRCHPADGAVSGSVTLEITVGCDGRVTESTVLVDDASDGTGEFAACVADTFKYAPFDAHARDGGVVFELPLRFD
jgi:hypothetical protein